MSRETPQVYRCPTLFRVGQRDTVGALTRLHETAEEQHALHRFTLAGREWTYRTSGSGDRVLVVLPGAIGGADVYFVLMSELEATTRVIAVDVPFTPHVEEVTIPSLPYCGPAQQAIMLSEAFAYHERNLRSRPQEFGEIVRALSTLNSSRAKSLTF